MTSRRWDFALLLAAFMLTGCATAPQPEAAKPPASLGDSKESAIEVCNPPGQRAYLSRLVCADGSRPSFKRLGSYGARTTPPDNMSKEQSAAVTESILSGRALKPGEADYHVVDGYEVTCGAVKRTIYMDMYHCQSAPTERAPAGFTLQGKN